MQYLPSLSAVVFAILVAGASPPGSGAPPQEPASALKWQFEYDQDRITKVVDPAARETTIAYDLDGADRLRSATRTHADGSRVTYRFSPSGRRLEMIDAAGTVRYEYDEFGRLVTVRRDDRPPLAYAYDTLDRLSSLTLDGLTIRHTFDFRGRLSAIETPAGRVTYEYRTGQGMILRTLPNGLRTVWQYQPDGRLESIAHVDPDDAILAQFSYSYRPDGLISACRCWSPRGENVVEYQYDVVQRLTAVLDSGSGEIGYRYDKLGNQTELLVDGRQQASSTYDWAGRIVTSNGEPCAHDPAGNLTGCLAAQAKRSCEFDTMNRLQSAATDKGKVRYQYDGDGCLIARQVANAKTLFLPDPQADVWRPLLAVDGEGKRTLYVWEGHYPLAAIGEDKTEFFLHDHLGSVRCIADQDGAIVDRFDYSPFGVPRQPSENSDLRPGFAGLFFDPSASLYLTRARAYDPNLGRFLQRDPAQRILLASQEDLCAYAYCHNDPVNFVDFSGCRSTQPAPLRWIIDVLRIIKRAVTPSVSVNSTMLMRGQSSTPIGPDYYSSVATEDRDTISPFTLAGIGIQFSWGDRPQRDTQYVSFDVGLNQYLGVSHYYWEPQPGQERGGISLNLGVALGLPVNVTHTGPAKSGPVYYGPRKIPESWKDTELRAAPASTRRTSPDDVARQGLPVDCPILEESRKYLPGDGGGGGGPGGPGGGPGGGEPGGTAAPLYPSNVGGVYLRGAGKALAHLGALKGVAVDDRGRLVLLSQAQGEIELPALRMDDVVAVFRSVYDHGEAPFVSIDPDPDDPRGPVMLVRHGPATADTYVGWVLFEADRVMKTYSLGYDNVTRQKLESRVDGYKNLLDLGFSNAGGRTSQSTWERFWIVPAEVNRHRTADGRLTLLDVPLKLNTQKMVLRDGKLVPAGSSLASKEARLFALWFTKHYDRLCQEALSEPPGESDLAGPVPVFAELRRLALITAIAESLRDQGTPMPSWMRDYHVRPFPVAATTPAMLVEASKTETNRVVKGDRIRVVEKTLRRGLYGGVNLSPSDGRVRTDAGLPRVEELLPRGWDQIADAPVLSPVPVQDGDTRYSAVALPGDQTADVGPCLLEEVDLAVPVQRGREIYLTRKFHSFFQPKDAFGQGWTLDLPRLERQRVPLRRTEDETEYRIRHRLTSPLSSHSATFSKLQLVPEVQEELQVPDDAPQMLGLAGSEDERIGYATEVLLFRDGRSWHFNDQGSMAAWTDGALMVVYRRGQGGRIERVEGWYGENLRADVRLRYDGQDRVVAARASNGQEIEYQYNQQGMLTRVSKPGRTLHYQYDRGLVTGVARDGKIVAKYSYADNGRLRTEQHADGSRTTYRVDSGRDGVQIAAVSEDADGRSEVSASARYDPAFRPLQRVLPDGTEIDYRYPDGATEAAIRPSDGDPFVVTQSADGNQIAWRSSEGGTYSAEYDEAGRVTELCRGDRPIVEHKWRDDGLLDAAVGETWAVHPEYREDGIVAGMLLTPPEEGPEFQRWLQIAYDGFARPVKVTDSAGFEADIQYDETGQPAAVRSQRAGIVVRREAPDKVASVRTSWGYSQTNTYDDEDKLKTATITQGDSEAAIEFDQGRPSKLRQFDGGEAEVSYYEDGPGEGLARQLRTPNEVVMDYGRDASGRPESVRCGEVFRLELTRDMKGRLTEYAHVPIY